MPRYVVELTYEVTLEADDQNAAIEDAEEQIAEMIAEHDRPELWGIFVQRKVVERSGER